MDKVTALLDAFNNLPIIGQISFAIIFLLSLFGFKELFIDWRKENSNIVSKYKKNKRIVRNAAVVLEARIQNLLFDADSDWLQYEKFKKFEYFKKFGDGFGYYIISTDYLFCKYFASIYMMQSDLDGMDNETSDLYSKLLLSANLAGDVLKDDYIFKQLPQSAKEPAGFLKLTRQTKAYIGHMMIDASSEKKRILSFREFCEKIENCPIFEGWVKNIRRYYLDLDKSIKLNEYLYVHDFRWARLRLMQYFLNLLIERRSGWHLIDFLYLRSRQLISFLINMLRYLLNLGSKNPTDSVQLKHSFRNWRSKEIFDQWPIEFQSHVTEFVKTYNTRRREF